LDLELSALESAGEAQIIASPRLLTMDRTPAVIEAGSEIPYQERSSRDSTSITFKKAVLSLKVTPQIMDNHHILLKLQVNQDKPSALQVQNAPAIDTRSLQTQVIVDSGETVVLGGIYTRSHQKSLQRIPFLGQIPIIGAIFTRRVKHDETKELLIFVTPHILKTHTYPSSNTE
jgi:type IV pilus assembly protein PilQ